MTNSPRAEILAQVSNGQLTADQAAQLLAAATPRVDLANRWLNIRITDLNTGKSKATINLPLSWVEAGMKLGARHTDSMPDINWSEVVRAIENGASGLLVDVEDVEDGQRVEISVR